MILTLCMMLSPVFALTHANESTHLIVMTDMGFIPNQLTVSQGDQIQLIVNNKDDVVRNLKIPDFNVKTPFLMEGEMASLKFEAKEKGVHHFYSQSPGINQPQLKGTIDIK